MAEFCWRSFTEYFQQEDERRRRKRWVQTHTKHTVSSLSNFQTLNLNSSVCIFNLRVETVSVRICVVFKRCRLVVPFMINSTETEEVVDRVKKFITNLYKFTDGDNYRLAEEVNSFKILFCPETFLSRNWQDFVHCLFSCQVRSIHTAQTRWMFNLLLLMVPDHCEEQDHDPLNISNVSVKTLEAEAKLLSDKVESFSGIITRYWSSCLSGSNKAN